MIKISNEVIGMTNRYRDSKAQMRRHMFILAIAALAAATPARADTFKLAAAGSLRAAMTELLQRFPRQSDTVDTPEFGSSGLMRQKIEAGMPVDVFASADLEQPRKLAEGHPERLVIFFARNSLCALGRPDLKLDQGNLLDRLLDPSVRIATSTPGNDPLGTYSFEVFARAEALKPGARATLEAKAKKLVGGAEKTPPLVPGKSAVEGIFLSDAADVMLIYCSAVPAIQTQIPALISVRLPPALTVQPVDGLVILNAKPVALRFVAYVMSEEGQAILRRQGLEPIALEPSRP